jgi:hypothetical protein
MKMIAMVCVCERDAPMLPIFLNQWKKLHPLIPVVIGNCKKNAIATNLQQYSIDWQHRPGLSIMRAMLSACIDHNAEVAFKLDVDCFHRRSFLPRLFDDPRIDAAGIQWLDNPHHFLGLAYGIRRRLLTQMEVSTTCSRWDGGEDNAMSWFARKFSRNGIYLFDPHTARRAQTDDGTASIVHCGSFYPVNEGRAQALAAMQRLTSFPVCPSVPLRS